MSYQVTDVDGVIRVVPDHAEMAAVLDDLIARVRGHPEEEFPEVFLTHSSGWMLSLSVDGIAVLESADAGEESLRVMGGLDREEQLMLWVQLAMGNIERMLALPWESELR